MRGLIQSKQHSERALGVEIKDSSDTSAREQREEHVFQDHVAFGGREADS